MEYLLSPSHPVGRSKAAFFAQFGFAQDEWQVLADALREHAMEHEIARSEESPFGVRYVIEGTLRTPSGQWPLVRSVWFVEEGGDGIPRFVTAYPLKQEEDRD